MSSVTPIRGVSGAREKPMCIRSQMVLGYISEHANWRAIDRAKGSRVIPIVKPAKPGGGVG
jgi:hypothetical protein